MENISKTTWKSILQWTIQILTAILAALGASTAVS
jgi:hypothetical protein